MSANDRSVRIGPISLFTLIAVLCLATLAVLSITTANASFNMARLQGTSAMQEYAAEAAAQDFVSQVDALGSAQAVSGQLDDIVEGVQRRADGVGVSADVDGSLVTAEFACANERVLNIAIAFGQGGSYEIVKWNLRAKVNEAETGNLWSGI